MGTGGLQPIAYTGAAPARSKKVEPRRPVVAILDTGCGKHPWLDGVVKKDVKLDGHVIGFDHTIPDLEKDGDEIGALDGLLDPHAGHGTFIAGLVLQNCPDVEILSWRIMPPDGPVSEFYWVTALAQIVELVDRHQKGLPGGHAIDVLSLSIGYYHETPEDKLFDISLYSVLAELTKRGVVVVCSAGNDATARENYPAAFAPWKDGKGPIKPTADQTPIVSVGCRNPNGTVSLFSNTGPWVRTYEQGAGVLSTMPPFEGSLQPEAETRAYGHIRETIDPDDFRGWKDRGGFAVWSGTSFAAPIVAGKIARALIPWLPAGDKPAEAVQRGWDAVTEVTHISLSDANR